MPDECDHYFDAVNEFIVDNKDIVSVETETWAMVYQFWKARHATMNKVERDHRRDQFAKFTAEYDTRRSLNFTATFPELAGWI